jgi:hypothetical protein
MEVTILSAISTVGFPIVVAMYSLIRLEKTVKDNTAMTEKLYQALVISNNVVAHVDTVVIPK